MTFSQATDYWPNLSDAAEALPPSFLESHGKPKVALGGFVSDIRSTEPYFDTVIVVASGDDGCKVECLPHLLSS